MLQLFIGNLHLGHTCPLEGLLLSRYVSDGSKTSGSDWAACFLQMMGQATLWSVPSLSGGHENRLASSVFWSQSQASQGRDLNNNHPSVTASVLLIDLLLFMLYCVSKNNKTIFISVKINTVISFIFAAGHAVCGSCIFRSYFDKCVRKSVL